MAEARGTAEMARTDRAPATHPRPCIPGHASSAWLAWPIGSGNLPSRAYVIFSAALQHLRSGCGAPASKSDPTSPRREASLLNLPVIQVVTGLFLAFSRSAADLRTVRASFRTYFESGTQGSDEPPWTALSLRPASGRVHGLSADSSQAGMVRRTARRPMLRPSSTHGAPSALAARCRSGYTWVASTPTALSRNRGPNSRSIDIRTPAVARREDEIDPCLVRASRPAPLIKISSPRGSPWGPMTVGGPAKI